MPDGNWVADRTAIEWTDATFNPWWGCERVSPACAHCYADSLAKRYGHSLWDASRTRRFFGEAHWKRPSRWHAAAEKRGIPHKVFCASMADVFEDHSELKSWRARLWSLIEETPWLHWQLLTKRPEVVTKLVPWGNTWPRNVWIGTSIENARHTFRADILREIPASVRFVSAEPILGSLFANGTPKRRPLVLDGIDWLIAGGESGPRSRPCETGWVRELRDSCSATGTAFFLKQLGGHPDKRGKDKALLDGRLYRALPNAPLPS
jgi:protein gp37